MHGAFRRVVEEGVSGGKRQLDLVIGGAAHDVYHCGQIRLLGHIYDETQRGTGTSLTR